MSVGTMLYATTSNGVYLVERNEGRAHRILGNKHTKGLFTRRARGYFGIAHHEGSGNILVASRERGRTRRHNKPTTDVKLHFLDPDTQKTWLAASVEDVHDVHQIALDGDRVFLTDTGKNRVISFDLLTGKRLVLNVGQQRDDINHINAVHVHEDVLLIGLNNRGRMPAAILRIPLSTLALTKSAESPDLLTIGDYREIPGAAHTHDLAIDGNGELFACASHDGIVFNIETEAVLLSPGGWTRGLAFSPAGLWVGTSKLASRESRHSESLDGELTLYELPGGRVAKKIVLENAGQVNDVLCLETLYSERTAIPENKLANLV